MSETKALLDFLRAKRSPFFVARIFLKLGREVPESFASPEEDKAVAALVRETALALGAKDLPGG